MKAKPLLVVRNNTKAQQFESSKNICTLCLTCSQIQAIVVLKRQLNVPPLNASLEDSNVGEGGIFYGSFVFQLKQLYKPEAEKG